jgi:hypothetical protein
MRIHAHGHGWPSPGQHLKPSPLISSPLCALDVTVSGPLSNGGQENRMPNRAGNTATSTEVIPAGHAAFTAEEELGGHRSDTFTGFAGLSVAALGVVSADIGTSPVYTFRECFNPEHGLPLDAEYVLGVLSMIFWALIIVVTIKYVLLIMRADNQGEGGILALLALALEATQSERSRTLLILLALGGAALFYGDSMITPAISVLSAVEGIGIATPALQQFVLPLTVAVLLALFFFQKGGTERVGRLFGPVMVLWFAVLAVTGGFQIAEAPRVLAALNSAHAVGIFVAAPAAGFVVLGAVALAITGGEALYADMGHFGRFPVRLTWFALVLPALVLNYFGQGALILDDKSAIENPFFRMVPDWGLVPLVLLSTAATVIASQAVISGAFSLSRQAIQLGLMPPFDIFQTSTRAHGQIYIPQVNWLLLIAVLALVLGFQSSSALASAYGFAVTGTMTITTVLATAVMRGVWRPAPQSFSPRTPKTCPSPCCTTSSTTRCCTGQCCSFASSPRTFPEWPAQTGSRPASSAAVFGRLRRVSALPRRRTYRGSSPREHPGAGTRSEPDLLLRRARQRQTKLAARDGPVARAPLFRPHTRCDAAARGAPHPAGPRHRARR